MKRRIMLTIAYDGTAYCGWQIQPDAPTIEGILNETISRMLSEDIRVTGASRTDAGVHALGTVAVFDTESTIPADKFPFVINQGLPADIKVLSSRQVPDDFHPRKAECRKTYEYSIYNGCFMLPIRRLYAHHVFGSLDVGRMKKAAAYLVGEHDFASFMGAGSQALTTVRTIYDLSVREYMPGTATDDREALNTEHDAVRPGRDSDREIVISVTGNGFLYNMVRIIAGTLIDVGQGRFEPEDVTGMLEACDRKAAGQTAPACGLCLVGYEYDI